MPRHRLVAAAAGDARRGTDAAARTARRSPARPGRRAAAWTIDEIDHHDAEQGRDHQQQAADDVGEHGCALLSCAAALRPLAAPCSIFARPLAGSTHQANRSTAVARARSLRMAELVPVGDAGRPDVPVRDHVVAPQQHAVERAAGGDQVLAVVGGDDLADQLVDDRVLDADQVAAARRDRRPRSPRSRAARCRAKALAERRSTIMSKSKVSIRFWYCAWSTRAQVDLDAEPLQVLGERAGRCARKAAESSRISNSNGSPVAALTSLPPLISQPASLSSSTALRRLSRLLPEPSVDRRLVGRGEHLRRQLVAIGLEHRQLVGPRAGPARPARSWRSSCRCGCTGRRTGSCWSTRSRRRSPAPGAPAGPGTSARRGVEDEALHAGAALGRDLQLDDQALVQRRAVIAGGPEARAVLDPQVELPGLERLERHVRVAVVFVADLRRNCCGPCSPGCPRPNSPARAP